MKIQKAEYLTSVVSANKILNEGIEFAFAGRSNVGKSSFINSLLATKKLAKTSSTPGRTRMINYFMVNDEFRLVDLPGYGYHKAGKKNELMWATLMEDYLQYSPCIKRVFMLVDIRHEPTDLDKRMLQYLTYTGRPFSIIATKADKIAKSKIPAYVSTIAKKLFVTANNIIPYSRETLLNRDKILDLIQSDIDTPTVTDDVDENMLETQE